MSGSDVALVVLMVVALAAVAILAVTTMRLAAVLSDLKASTESFVRQATPLLEELSDAARGASSQVDRLDDLIGTAGQVTRGVDDATSATVRVLSNPVIKTAALAKGTKRAARRLRSAPEQ